jgi:hypothetical protein
MGWHPCTRPGRKTFPLLGDSVPNLREANKQLVPSIKSIAASVPIFDYSRYEKIAPIAVW